MLQGFTVGSNAFRAFCAPIRRARRLAPVRLDKPTATALARREPRMAPGSVPVERPWLAEARERAGYTRPALAAKIGTANYICYRLEQEHGARTTAARAALLQQLLGLTDAQREELTSRHV
jgi:ribosome-binding protein aMBF1 (putative translation factor)